MSSDSLLIISGPPRPPPRCSLCSSTSFRTPLPWLYEAVALAVHIAIGTLVAVVMVTFLPDSPAPARRELSAAHALKIHAELDGWYEPGIPELRSDQVVHFIVRHDALAGPDPVLYIIANNHTASDGNTLPPRRIVPEPSKLRHVGSAVHYRGPVDDLLGLPAGEWSLTFLMGDPTACDLDQRSRCSTDTMVVRIGRTR